jgi:hypothetical protein
MDKTVLKITPMNNLLFLIFNLNLLQKIKKIKIIKKINLIIQMPTNKKPKIKPQNSAMTMNTIWAKGKLLRMSKK